jgi:hypothetical protein
MKPMEGPEFKPCMDCISYRNGVCWLHGVKVRGTTLDRACFKPKTPRPIDGRRERKDG